MNTRITNEQPAQLTFRRTLATIAAAGAIGVILLSLSSGRVAASSGIHETVVNGTLVISGTSSSDRIALRVSRAHPNRLQIDAGDNGTADQVVPLRLFTRIDLQTGAGNDRVRLDASGGTFTFAKPTTVHGGKGNDTLIGGDGSEAFVGGSGSDTLVDTASVGDDDFVATAVSGGVVLTRTQPGVVGPGVDRVRLAGVETMRLATLAGIDNVTLHDLAGTGVKGVDVDLASEAGASTADGQVDTVAIFGTAGNDTVAVTASSGTVVVGGLGPTIRISHAELGDNLTLDTLGGTDTVSIDPAVAGLINVLGQ